MDQVVAVISVISWHQSGLVETGLLWVMATNSLQTAFGFLIWAAWCSWLYLQGMIPIPSYCHPQQCALDRRGGCVCA